MASFAFFALMVLVYTLLSGRLTALSVSAPIIFVLVGGFIACVLTTRPLDGDAARLLAESTLALILFHDAAHARPRELLGDWRFLARLLLIGLPLAILAGWVVAQALFPGAGAFVALFIAAALAPTDAGLSAPTVLNPVVPTRVRRLLNGESGLNDGLATPVVLFAIAAADAQASGGSVSRVAGEAVAEIGIGVLVGAVVGFGVGALLRRSEARGWATTSLVPVGVVAIPLFAYFGASVVHGNGFIAAFISGTTYAGSAYVGGAAAAAAKDVEGGLSHDLSVTEAVLTLMGYAVWCLFGVTVIVHLRELLDWRVVLFALLALTLLRMIPVWLSLLGSGLRLPTVGFIAWFGPRGLATVVFALIALEDSASPVAAPGVLAVLALTVLLSVMAHGVSASPLASAYGRWADRVQPAQEMAG